MSGQRALKPAEPLLWRASYLISTVAPASVNFFLIVSASSLETFSFTFLGAPSTRSLASFRPRLVTSRTALITLILLAPEPVRTTVNSVFSSAGAAPAAAPPPAIITGAAAAAETPRRSSSFFTSWAASSRLNPTIESSNCCKSAIVFLHSDRILSVLCAARRFRPSRSNAPRLAPREVPPAINPCPEGRTTFRKNLLLLCCFLELLFLHALVYDYCQVLAHGIHHRDQTLRRSIDQEQQLGVNLFLRRHGGQSLDLIDRDHAAFQHAGFE